MEQFSKIVQERLQARAKAEVHPDADLLTAFAEKSMGDRERSQVLRHLAECANCREVVSLAMPEPRAEPEIQPRFSDSRWLRSPVLRWAALAACIVVAGTMATRRFVQFDRPAQFDRSASTALKHVEPQLQNSLEVTNQATDDRLVARDEPPSPLRLKRDVNGLPTGAKAVGGPVPTAAMTGSVPPTMALSKKENTPESKAASVAVQIPAMSEMVKVDAAPAPSQPASSSATTVAGAARAGQMAQSGQGVGGGIGAGVSAPSSSNEVVEVTAESPVVETAQLQPGKAKDSKNAQEKIAQSPADLPVVGRNYTQLVTLAPSARWSLSAKGVVERSVDAGKSWQPVAVADHVVFHAISALGSEIWVGGAAGALYHSSDSGQSWVQVRLSAAGTPLTADVITLQFGDALNGKLSTADRQVWTTSDGGVSWQKQ